MHKIDSQCSIIHLLQIFEKWVNQTKERIINITNSPSGVMCIFALLKSTLIFILEPILNVKTFDILANFYSDYNNKN